MWGFKFRATILLCNVTCNFLKLWNNNLVVLFEVANALHVPRAKSETHIGGLSVLFQILVVLLLQLDCGFYLKKKTFLIDDFVRIHSSN